jgi:hypothetical protein
MTPEEFYRRYPSFAPFVGSTFSDPAQQGRPRILLIGESHYLPEAATLHHRASDWFAGDQATLLQQEKQRTGKDTEWLAWIHTAGVVRNALDKNFPLRPHSLWRNALAAINDAGPNYPDKRRVGEEIAFFNFFQRPALQGASLRGRLTPEDDALANAVFAYELDRLRPTAVVFLSRLAEDKLTHRLSVPSVATPHPGCRWWNTPARPYGNRTGKAILEAFVREHLRWPTP